MFNLRTNMLTSLRSGSMSGFQAEIAPQLYPAMRIHLFIVRMLCYSGTVWLCYNHNRILMRVIRRLTPPAPDQARLPTSDPLEPAELAETERSSGLELTWSWAAAACWPIQRWSHRWWGCSTGHSSRSVTTCIANIFSYSYQISLFSFWSDDILY